MDSKDIPKFTQNDVEEIFSLPILELTGRAISLHRQFHDPSTMEKCILLSIKTGGCSEDCAYCAQSSRYATGIPATKLLDLDYVLQKARDAKKLGATYFCLSAAWRKVHDSLDFEKALEMIREIKKIPMNVCCTLGMLTPDQARKLKEAGVSNYNHNLDSSREFYPKIITTRSYQDRLETLKNASKVGLGICCGGILGLGESVKDRIDFIYELSCLTPSIQAVTVNTLVPIPKTPLEKNEPPSFFDLLRFVATVRAVMPRVKIRWAAGRSSFSQAEQALLFLCGVNSVHIGEKLLTTLNCKAQEDELLFANLEGLALDKVF